MSGFEHIIIPGTEGGLLRRELASAFAALGCSVSIPDPARLFDESYHMRLSELLDGRPALLFSINGNGLHPQRRVMEFLERAKGAACLWFVDNPWNVLSGMREPGWKALPLFVTDQSFIPALRKHGAQTVYHLPLAASPEVFAPDPEREAAYPAPAGLAPLVFVGRSAFPGVEHFFAGLSLPENFYLESRAMLFQGKRPDFFWWEKRLACGEEPFWPGKNARLPAFGAEEANREWRGICLAEAVKAGRELGGAPGLDVFGDAGWKNLLAPGTRLRPQVDYYARLPAIYSRAEYSLCMTSLQLPQGLNQRHFDIWMAGGVCISDATPGLEIFPEDLVRPMRFHKPGELSGVILELERRSACAGLLADWQAHLLERHTYRHRVAYVLKKLGG